MFPRLPHDKYVELCERVFRRDGYKCRYCGRRNNLHAHHVVYRSHGGADTEENLITLCSEHHEDIHRGRLIYEPDPST
jgi:5-methylcytosine-specific restriction endonuclease McrA